MTVMQITAAERAMVRLFVIDLPDDQIEAFREPTYSDSDEPHWPLKDALGATYLDEDFVEVFDVLDLENLGLVGYMAEGLGIAKSVLTADRARLEGIRGTVLIVLSSAFSGAAQTLRPKAPLRWIGTYCEDTPPVQFEPLPSDAAKGNAPSGAHVEAPANAHMTLLIAVLALPILALLAGAIFWGVWR